MKRKPTDSRRWRFLSVLAIGLAAALYSSPAQAYIDPGSGSLILQAAIGALAAGALAIKMFFWRIVGFFSPRKKIDVPDASSVADTQQGTIGSDLPPGGSTPR